MTNYFHRAVLRTRWLEYVEHTFETMEAPEQISAVVDACIGELTDDEVELCIVNRINCVD